MRSIGRLLGILLALAVVLAAAAYLLPRQVTVTREIVVEAPPARIFPYVNSLQRVAQWSPWTGRDPATKTTFAGPDSGPGNRMEWSSPDPRIGRGSQEIIVSVPDRRVETALQVDGMGIATAWQDLHAEEDGTRVTWGFLADLGASPRRRFAGLLLDRRLGRDIEDGLARLKALVEADAPPPR